MRRSMLFIPGNNPSMLQNSDVFESDSIIIDLEDAVNVMEKDSARNLVKCYLDNLKNKSSELVIRINGLDTDYYLDDLNQIVCEKIDAIMLPKAHINDLKKLDEILTSLEKERNIVKMIKIIPIVELAESLLEVETMAFQNRVDGILLGAEDFTSDLEVTRTKDGEEIFYARNRIAVACAAAKIDAIDTPFTDTKDNLGLEKDCEKAISLGMKSKSCIHPNQIETVNEMFSPSQKTIDWAKRILQAKIDADKKGLGAFSVDGKMVDKPIIERAQKILKKAEKYHIL